MLTPTMPAKPSELGVKRWRSGTHIPYFPSSHLYSKGAS